jgi:hypothetical protein
VIIMNCIMIFYSFLLHKHTHTDTSQASYQAANTYCRSEWICFYGLFDYMFGTGLWVVMACLWFFWLVGWLGPNVTLLYEAMGARPDNNGWHIGESCERVHGFGCRAVSNNDFIE